MRLVAEVGLVGLPNAGKSTLLRALTAARPKVAPYPFTTITPNLGRVMVSDEEAFSIADIPGLIEGAHLGQGLGIRFLRHVSRTSVLVYVLDASGTPAEDFRVVRGELKAFDPELPNRPSIVALNKMDLVAKDEAKAMVRKVKAATHLNVIAISAEKHAGLDPLVAAISAEPARYRSPENTGRMPQLDYKQAILKGAKRVVIKVGSAVLSDVSGLDAAVIVRLAAEVDEAVRDGHEIIVVTSGAIAAGRARLAKLSGPTIGARQAAAATGQIEVMRSWAAAFSECDRTVAQILLTHEDVSERKRRQNAMQTITTLLASGVIPIINENDTVAVEEIRFGDNDMLSSLVASMVQAQMLVILSDVAGVLTGDPRQRSDAHLIPLITNPEAEMKGLVAESAGPLGTGGMASKLKAAQQAARAGIAVIIAPGREPGTIAAALDPAREIGTLITPAGTRLKSRKH